MVIEHQQIKKFLRQRAPFLLVDRITQIEGGVAVGLKNVSGTDPCLVGHFDDEPILPGVVLVEAMSQVGGVLIAHDPRYADSTGGFLAGIDKVKFKKFVVPGDQVVIEARGLVSAGRLARLNVSAHVEGQEVACGEISYYLR